MILMRKNAFYSGKNIKFPRYIDTCCIYYLISTSYITYTHRSCHRHRPLLRVGERAVGGNVCGNI